MDSETTLLHKSDNNTWNMALFLIGLVISVSDSGQGYIYNSFNGKLLLELNLHTDWIQDLAFCKNTLSIVSGSKDTMFCIWNIFENTKVRFQGNGYEIFSVSFSPDGTKIITGTAQNAIIYNAYNGVVISEIKGHEKPVFSCAFSENGSKIATASDDGLIIISDANTGSSIIKIVTDLTFIISIIFSPDASMIVSGADEGNLKIWNTLNGSLVRILHGHTDIVTCIAFNVDGTKLVTGSDDKTVRIWNTEDGSLIRTIEGHESALLSVSFNKNSVVSISQDHVMIETFL
jgi:WD40 repeat protein